MYGEVRRKRRVRRHRPDHQAGGQVQYLIPRLIPPNIGTEFLRGMNVIDPVRGRPWNGIAQIPKMAWITRKLDHGPLSSPSFQSFSANVDARKILAMLQQLYLDVGIQQFSFPRKSTSTNSQHPRISPSNPPLPKVVPSLLLTLLNPPTLQTPPLPPQHLRPRNPSLRPKNLPLQIPSAIVMNINSTLHPLIFTKLHRFEAAETVRRSIVGRDVETLVFGDAVESRAF